jgi:hypothetical protein
MKKYFVWAGGVEQVILHALSDTSKRGRSNRDVIVSLFSRVALFSEHYYEFAVATYRLSRSWKSINRSSIFRRLERTQHLWEGVGLICDAIEVNKALSAPTGSIIVIEPDIGGISIDVIRPDDPNYSEAFARLPGAA